MTDQRIEERIRQEAEALEREWDTDPRWRGVERPYSAEDVVRLRGSFRVEHSIARARRRAPVGARARRGLRRRARRAHRRPGRRDGEGGPARRSTCRGWQVAADANLSSQTYPDQSLYPANSVPAGGAAHQQRAAARRPDRVGRGRARRHDGADRRRRRGRVRRHAERLRADEVDDRGGRRRRALRGPARVARRSAGTWAARSWCPTDQFIRTLTAARLAADVLGVPIAGRRAHRRARCHPAHDRHRRARPRASRPASARTRASTTCENGIDAAIARAQAYAPFADMIWCETVDARTSTRRGRSPTAIHALYPDKLLAYNCSPVVQLEAAPGRRHDRAVPEGARRDGLQVPVHHARRASTR